MLDLSAIEHDPLLEPKPLPRADLSLIGGIARKVDTVRNRVTVQPFGGGNKYLIYFDDRTRILSGGRETTALAFIRETAFTRIHSRLDRRCSHAR